MSRDQRPARVKMIDHAQLVVPASRADDTLGGNIAPGSAPGKPAQSGTVLWAALFLMACAAGAAGVALMPLLGFR